MTTWKTGREIMAPLPASTRSANFSFPFRSRIYIYAATVTDPEKLKRCSKRDSPDFESHSKRVGGSKESSGVRRDDSDRHQWRLVWQ